MLCLLYIKGTCLQTKASQNKNGKRCRIEMTLPYFSTFVQKSLQLGMQNCNKGTEEDAYGVQFVCVCTSA